jgi:hypothetical protein
MNVRATVLAAALAVSACAPRYLPGTEIDDTKDNRAVYELVLRYREALEKRDVNGILALVGPGYYDTAGTTDSGDDLDRARLETALREELPKAENLKVDFTIRRIEVNGDEAQAEIFFDSFYRVKTSTVSVPRRDSDVQRLRLKRIDNQWKFVAGL